MDFGRWWQERLDCRYRSGGNAIRRSLGPELMSRSERGPEQKAFSMRWIIAKRLWPTPCSLLAISDPQLADKFVGMYVNERTLDYGAEGREAICRCSLWVMRRGSFPHPSEVDFVRSRGWA